MQHSIGDGANAGTGSNCGTDRDAGSSENLDKGESKGSSTNRCYESSPGDLYVDYKKAQQSLRGSKKSFRKSKNSLSVQKEA